MVLSYSIFHFVSLSSTNFKNIAENFTPLSAFSFAQVNMEGKSEHLTETANKKKWRKGQRRQNKPVP